MSITKNELELGKSLTELYKLVQNYTDEPLGEIEKLAQGALNNGTLTTRDYLILQHRLPFSGLPRYSYKILGKEILQRRRQRAHQLEQKASKKLIGYLLRQQGLSIKERSIEDYLALSIDYLPWDVTSSHIKTKNILKRYLGYGVTIGQVLKLFETLETTNQPLIIKYYGRRAGEITYEVFSKAWIDLPQIEIKYSMQ